MLGSPTIFTWNTSVFDASERSIETGDGGVAIDGKPSPLVLANAGLAPAISIDSDSIPDGFDFAEQEMHKASRARIVKPAFVEGSGDCMMGIADRFKG